LFKTAAFDLACFVVVASIFGIRLACIVVGFLATVLAYSHRLEGSSVVSVVVGPAMSSSSSLHRFWACVVVVGLAASLLGFWHRRWACNIVVGPATWSSGLVHCCWASHIVIWLGVLSLGLPHHRLAWCVVIGPPTSSSSSLCFHWACVVVVGPATSYLVGLPLLGPPLMFSTPLAATYELLRSAHISR